MHTHIHLYVYTYILIRTTYKGLYKYDIMYAHHTSTVLMYMYVRMYVRTYVLSVHIRTYLHVCILTFMHINVHTIHGDAHLCQ